MQDQNTWAENMQSGPGKGRGVIQKAFHKTEAAASKLVKPRPNYLP